MYENIKKYEIRYTDADAFDNLKPSSLLAFLEESACSSADELGFGYTAIAAENLGFIVVNYYIELFRPIKLGETVEIHTWPLQPKHLIFLRDYELYIGGVKVGVATSRWCMINTQNYSMVPAAVFFDRLHIEYNTERSVQFNSWKIPAEERGEKVYSKEIAFSDYDHYFHVNNTKYADFLLDALKIDELKNKFIGKLQITYSKQCKMGEIIDMYRQTAGDEIIVTGNVGDEARVQFKVKLNEVQL